MDMKKKVYLNDKIKNMDYFDAGRNADIDIILGLITGISCLTTIYLLIVLFLR